MHQAFVFSPGGEMHAARRCVGPRHTVEMPLAQDRLEKKGSTCHCFIISAVAAHVVYGTTRLC